MYLLTYLLTTSKPKMYFFNAKTGKFSGKRPHTLSTSFVAFGCDSPLIFRPIHGYDC